MIDESGYRTTSRDKNGETWEIFAKREDAIRAVADMLRGLGHEKVCIHTDRSSVAPRNRKGT